MNPNLVVKNKLKKMTAKEKEIYLSGYVREDGCYNDPPVLKDLIDKSRISRNGMKPNNFYTAVEWGLHSNKISFEKGKIGRTQQAIMMLNDGKEDDEVLEWILNRMSLYQFEGSMIKYAIDQDIWQSIRERLAKQDKKRLK